jgi:tRNA pseudouridine65 synthase
MLPPHVDGIPTHVRDLSARDSVKFETANIALEESEAFRAVVLVAARESHLAADADPEDRFARSSRVRERRVEAKPMEILHRSACRPYSWKDDPRRSANDLGIARDRRLESYVTKGERHARQVAGAIVEYRDHVETPPGSLRDDERLLTGTPRAIAPGVYRRSGSWKNARAADILQYRCAHLRRFSPRPGGRSSPEPLRPISSSVARDHGVSWYECRAPLSPDDSRANSRRSSPKDDDFSRVLHPGVREVFRDGSLWVLDKPSGVLSHPNQPGKAPNVLLRAPYDKNTETFSVRLPSGAERQIWLIHRLDQETSGLILCSFDAEAASRLKVALFDREVEKEYRALIIGRIAVSPVRWEDALEKSNRSGRAEVRVLRGASPNAVTEVRVLKSFAKAGLTLVSLRPETGRTHQLRVQAASRGVPIAGDDRYGDFTANRYLAREIGLKKMFLHASRLEFRHPLGGQLLRFQREFGRHLAEPLAKLEVFEGAVPRRSMEDA